MNSYFTISKISNSFVISPRQFPFNRLSGKHHSLCCLNGQTLTMMNSSAMESLETSLDPLIPTVSVNIRYRKKIRFSVFNFMGTLTVSYVYPLLLDGVLSHWKQTEDSCCSAERDSRSTCSCFHHVYVIYKTLLFYCRRLSSPFFYIRTPKILNIVARLYKIISRPCMYYMYTARLQPSTIICCLRSNLFLNSQSSVVNKKGCTLQGAAKDMR